MRKQHAWPNRPRAFFLGAILAYAVAPLAAVDTAQNAAALKRLPSSIVLTQIPVAAVADKQPLCQGMLRAPYADQSRLLSLAPDGTRRVLTEGFSAARDPSLSFDGKRLLFAGKRDAKDTWNIYELNLTDNPEPPRQITRDLGNCHSPCYQSMLYVLDSPEPRRQLSFVSDAAGAENEFGGAPDTDIYSCKLDGSSAQRLTHNLSNEMDPFLMGNGRLIFAGWRRQSIDRAPLGQIALFGINIDGTDYALYAGAQTKRIRQMSCETAAGLVVFIETNLTQWDGSGNLASVTVRRPLHAYAPITTEKDGFFHSPSPLPDGAILASRRPADGSATHAVGRIDLQTGRFETLFDDPEFHDIQARLIAGHPIPDGRSSVVTEDDPLGKLYCLNVYTNDLERPEWLPLGSAKRLRVLEGVPSQARKKGDPPLAKRRILGEIDIEPDGSFQIAIPASIPIELQILDADGVAIRDCGWIWAKNHEPRGCIGCHEDGELTPEDNFVDAMRKPSVPVAPPEPERRTVDFQKDVAPILKNQCARCHQEGKNILNLDAPPRLTYSNLLLKHVHPGRARTSQLVWRLTGRDLSRPWDQAKSSGYIRKMPPGENQNLPEKELRAIIEWVDMGAMWSYE